MTINVTSRGQLYSFPTGTKQSVIDTFLKERFANGSLVDDRGVIYTRDLVEDGSYTVMIFVSTDFEYRSHMRKVERAKEERVQELEEELRNKRRRIHENCFQSSYVDNQVTFERNLSLFDTLLMDGRTIYILKSIIRYIGHLTFSS